MKNKIKDLCWGILFFVLMFLFIFWIIWYGTSDEVWYAGMHDQFCEQIDDPSLTECNCYQRFIKKEK